MHITPEARDALIAENEPLVVRIAETFRRAARVRRVLFEDILAAGRLGLVEAAGRYDPGRGEFETYAFKWIRGRISQEARDRPERTGYDLDTFIAKPRGVSLVIFFPCRSFTPQSICPHHGPIATHSRLCCAVCHRSGCDHYPELQLGTADRRPAPGPASAPTTLPPADPPAETRREKRRRVYGGRECG